MIQKDYTDKIDKFISSSQFDVLKSDPTNTYQKQIRNTLNSCKAIIHNEMKPRLINLNPKSPNTRGLIKVHKQEHPIRPIVNWTNAPAYKTAKHFTTALNKAISLPFAFNIMNSMQLINDLKEIKVHPHIRVATFDISNKSKYSYTRSTTYYSEYSQSKHIRPVRKTTIPSII
jgi:hypothetical protein